MSRLIDADALSEWLKDYGQKVIKGERKISLMYIWKHVQDMPTIETERKKGKWLDDYQYGYTAVLKKISNDIGSAKRT
jgi:hypothetical protein